MFVTELHVYPIKGCGGISRGMVEIDDYGLMGDRRFMVVDDQGLFMSQRKHPEMCRIRTLGEGGFLTVSFKGLDDLVIDPTMGANNIPVQIWDDEVMAADLGEAASLWFSQALGQKTRLVTIGREYSRNVQISDTDYSSKMHFGDACPILVTTTASLEELNSRISKPVPMNRFRPNLVIDGTDPYAEDTWKYIQVGDQLLQFGKKCGRCTVTTIDQETGETGMEPLKTLSTYRKEGSKVCFGAYYFPITKGLIAVGDEVIIKN